MSSSNINKSRRKKQEYYDAVYFDTDDEDDQCKKIKIKIKTIPYI